MRYLNALHKSHIPLTIQIISTGLHYLWCYVFVLHLNLGVEGAALATSLTYLTNFLGVLVYTTLIDGKLRRIW